MKRGKTLVELATEVQRQHEVKKDYIAITKALEMDEDLNLHVGDKLEFGVNNLAHEQIGGHLRIPRDYYDRMRASEPRLLAHNVNTWFQKTKEDEKRMIRTLDGTARAFKSNGYRPLDNYDLLEAALPPLEKIGVEVLSCEITERRLYLKVVDQRIKLDLPEGVNLGEGHQRFTTISPAVTISNSEVGDGALAVLGSVFDGGCTNLVVLSERSVRKYHIGARQDVGEDIYKMLSDQTKAITDAAIWAQIGDVVKGAFDRAQFDAVHQKMINANKAEITGDPVKVVEVTAKKFGFSDHERGSVLKHLIQRGNLTQYGLQAAITRAAEDAEDYERASAFERIGGQVIELKPQEWKELAKAA